MKPSHQLLPIIFALCIMCFVNNCVSTAEKTSSEVTQNREDENELGALFAKLFARHPMGLLLGHAIIDSIDKTNPKSPGLAIRGRRYQNMPLSDQSFLRFGRQVLPYSQTKRPSNIYDLNGTSFLRFGRSK